MSATMSTASFDRRRPGWICGVCADLAERAAVPVLIPRVAFGVFLALHCVLASVLYFGLAYLLSSRPCARFAGRQGPQSPPRFSTPGFSNPASATADFATTDQRFRNLDERLSRLEAATVDSEAELRRAFRDLDRRR
jgi:phage shock protein PspC (stress-responsive transcriptional regulator)